VVTATKGHVVNAISYTHSILWESRHSTCLKERIKRACPFTAYYVESWKFTCHNVTALLNYAVLAE